MGFAWRTLLHSSTVNVFAGSATGTLAAGIDTLAKEVRARLGRVRDSLKN